MGSGAGSRRSRLMLRQLVLHGKRTCSFQPFRTSNLPSATPSPLRHDRHCAKAPSPVPSAGHTTLTAKARSLCRASSIPTREAPLYLHSNHERRLTAGNGVVRGHGGNAGQECHTRKAHDRPAAFKVARFLIQLRCKFSSGGKALGHWSERLYGLG